MQWEAGSGLLAMNFQRRGGEPLYRQLYGELRDMILDGRLSAATRLPANRALAADLSLSRNTVATAMQQLLAEGYVETRHGDGTYVATELPDAGPSEAPPIPTGDDVARHYGLSRRGRALAAIGRGNTDPDRAFVPGPDLSHFPFDVWGRLLARFWRRPGSELAACRDAGGYPPLRAAIAGYLGAVRGVRCSAEQVVVVSGAQQAIHLAAQVLLDHGDQALVEEPGYAGVRGALTSAGLRIGHAPVDDEGLMIHEGEARAPLARMVCVAPSHQHPLGVVMSLRRRLDLIEWARRRRAWILEDDYDSEYRYAGRPLAALQGLDPSGRVIYVGSFSKVLFPSLRLGYLVVPPDLVEAFLRARRVLDDHTSMLAQPVLAQFIADGHFAAHVRRMRRLYAARQKALLAAAERYLAPFLQVAPDEAGMHLIAWPTEALSRRLNDVQAAERAGAADVTVLPLSTSHAGRATRQGLMLGYAAHDEGVIEAAARRLGGALAA
ncbi:MAG: PLP-dependent aminotransferase family protein [Alphaproteobacteria bacterium]|nr:PLP-dependent aminotransferase family protein [Alphaproteobacteria bacterium]MDP6815867.1 PLP-dependent aminotransferase family protein [Alphaproteobacteria bacterium]